MNEPRSLRGLGPTHFERVERKEIMKVNYATDARLLRS